MSLLHPILNEPAPSQFNGWLDQQLSNSSQPRSQQFLTNNNRASRDVLMTECSNNSKISELYICPNFQERQEQQRRRQEQQQQQQEQQQQQQELSIRQPVIFPFDRWSNWLATLYENPDFQYSTHQVMEGGKNLARYFLNHLPQVAGMQQRGGNQGASNQNFLINQLKQSSDKLGQVARDIFQKVTVSEAIEGFASLYQGQKGFHELNLDPQLRQKLESLRNDGIIYSYLFAGLLGNVSVDQMIQNCLKVVQGTSDTLQRNQQLKKCLEQGGGAFTNLIGGQALDYQQELNNLFDALKSTVDYLTRSFKRRVSTSPESTQMMESVEQIQKGLNLSLQILQYQLVNHPPVPNQATPSPNQIRLSSPPVVETLVEQQSFPGSPPISTIIQTGPTRTLLPTSNLMSGPTLSDNLLLQGPTITRYNHLPLNTGPATPFAAYDQSSPINSWASCLQPKSVPSPTIARSANLLPRLNGIPSSYGYVPGIGAVPNYRLA